MARKPSKYEILYSAPVNRKKPQWLIDIIEENEKRKERQKRIDQLYAEVDQLAKAFDASLGRRARGSVAGRARRLLAMVFEREFEKKRKRGLK